mgnify:CR=1 FL=1
MPKWFKFVIAILLLVSLFRYWMHRFQHRNEFLWSLHSYHHRVTDLRAFLRQHPDEVAACSRQIRVLQVNQRTLDLFGARAVSSIIGTLYTGAAFGNLAGPWVAGAVFDATGHYGPVIAGCIVLSVLSTVAAWRAARR